MSDPVAVTMLTEPCTRCRAPIVFKDAVLLELDAVTGLFHQPGEILDPTRNQGGFAFGRLCAQRELARTLARRAAS